MCLQIEGTLLKVHLQHLPLSPSGMHLLCMFLLASGGSRQCQKRWYLPALETKNSTIFYCLLCIAYPQSRVSLAKTRKNTCSTVSLPGVGLSLQYPSRLLTAIDNNDRVLSVCVYICTFMHCMRAPVHHNCPVASSASRRSNCRLHTTSLGCAVTCARRTALIARMMASASVRFVDEPHLADMPPRQQG